MAYGVERARQFQLGQETVPGTAVTATALWRGPAASLVNPVELTVPSENIGYLMAVDRGYFPSGYSTYEQPQTELTFEQALYPLSAGVKSVAATANGGTTTAYVWTYPLASTAAGFVTTTATDNVDPVMTYTLKAGDNNQAYKAAFCFVEEITLTGAPDQMVQIASRWRGQTRIKTTFDSITPVTVEEIPFNTGLLYLDNTGGTIGATNIADTWLGFSLTLTTGWVAVVTGSGQLHYTFIKLAAPQITGSVTFEYNAHGTAAEDDFAANTTQLMRMRFPGSALTGTGGTYAMKLFEFDSAIKITSAAGLESQDGDDTITLNFSSIQGNVGQVTPTFIVCNLLAAIP